MQGKPMIYTVGGIKGGSGKTTVATNLATMLGALGRDVLLVDSDDQGSATDFTTWRNERLDGQAGFTAVQLAGANVRQQVLAMAPKYTDVVIDTGGRDTTSQRAALTVADVALFPFQPRAIDIWTIEKLSRLINEILPANPGLKAFMFLSRADHQGKDNDEAATALQEARDEHNVPLMFLETPLFNRKSFGNAAAGGLGIAEYEPLDTKAIREFQELFKAVTGLEPPESLLKGAA